MTETVTLALIAGVIGLVSPLLMSWLTNRNRRMEKMEDYARQDQVAALAAKAAEHARETERLLVVNSARQATVSSEIGEKLAEHGSALKQIHMLVNSNMTAALQAEHDATARELAMMREVIDLKKLAGHEPTPSAIAAINRTEGRLDELAALLRDRLKTTQEETK